MLKKVLVFGGSGMLGKELSRTFQSSGYEVAAPSHQEVNISDQAAALQAISNNKPDIILNAAVLVNVDTCETEPNRAYTINTLGPLFIADALRTLNLTESIFIQFSSSDIFGSATNESPKEDQSDASSKNVYGRSKYYGEQAIHGMLDGKYKTYIIRSSWIYSEFKKTFVDVIAEYALQPKGAMVFADDQQGLPTWGKDIAEGAKALIEEKYPPGIYHFTEMNSREAPSRFQIAEAILEMFSASNETSPIKKGSRKDIFKAPRPASSLLTNTRFRHFPNWKESLQKFLTEKYRA